MKHFLFIVTLMVAFLGNAQLCKADTSEDPTKQGVITTPPAGEERHYYLDLLNYDPYDNNWGYLSENHVDMTLVFAANNEVYMRCPLGRNIFPAWIKGTLSADGKTLTVKNGQTVYHAPNHDVDYIFVKSDTEGKGGENNGSSDLYDGDIVFNIDQATGVITPVTTIECPDVAIVNKMDVGEMFQQGRYVKYTPVETIDKNVTFYKMSYYDVDALQQKEASVKVSVEDGGKAVYFKGLYPKYPQTWIKAEILKADGIYWVAINVLDYDKSSDYPYFTLCYDRQPEESKTLMTFPIKYNEADGTYTFHHDTQTMAAGFILEGQNELTTLGIYKNITLTPTTQSKARPVAPKTYSYMGADGMVPCYEPGDKESEFKFLVDKKDTEGNVLNEDNLRIRIYTDDKQYTFTRAEYPRLKEESITDIPFSYNDNNHILTGSEGKRYIYFKTASAPKSTIGVELVYTVDGEEFVSDRLVYDIATGKDTVVTGISATKGNLQVKAIEYYDLSGRRMPNAEKGVSIKLTRYADGSVKAMKMVK